MRAVAFTGAGGNEVVRLEERPDPAPGTHDIVVRVLHAGLNPADVQQRAGRYPAPAGSPADIPGLEVAGTVESCGAGITAWRSGDRVFGLVGGGGLADRVAVHESCVAAIPDELDDPAAAAIPEAFITAHDAISAQAGLRPGEVLLVHGSAGGVGSAAIQIGVSMGARVFGTVRSEAARKFLRSLGCVPVADEGFAATVLEATGGADVILELVGAPHFPENLHVVALKGRVMVVGVGAGSDVEFPLLSLLQRRCSIRGTVLRPRPLEEKATAVRAFEQEVVPALAAGQVRAIIDSVFPVERVTDAFDRVESRGKTGKVLIDFSA